MGAMVAPCTAGMGRTSATRRPASVSVSVIGSSGVTASAVQMNTAGTTTNRAHSAGLRRGVAPGRSARCRGLAGPPDPGGRRRRSARAVRVRDTATTQATATAATVQASAQPRSPGRPPCPEGRSTIHRVTKWVGSTRVATWSAAPMAGPKNTSRIQTNSIDHGAVDRVAHQRARPTAPIAI